MENVSPSLESVSTVGINNPDFLLIEPTYLVKGNLVNRSEIDFDQYLSNQAIIRIDQIRKIRQFLSRKAIQSKKKMCLNYRCSFIKRICIELSIKNPRRSIEWDIYFIDF